MQEYWLETPRLGFSRWREDDLDQARRLWGNPAVTRFISQAGIFTEQEISERLAAEVARGRRHGLQYWPVFLRRVDAFVGCCGLRPYAAETGSAELGVHLLPQYWRQGYAREASQAVIAYAFQQLGLRMLVAGHHPQNKASERALLALGFVRAGEEYYPPTGLQHPFYRLLSGNIVSHTGL